MCVCVCSSCYCCISLTDMAGKPSILFKFRRLMVFAHFSFIPPRCLSTIYFYGIRTTIKHEEWSTAVFNILNICFPWYMNSKYCKWMLNMKYVWSWSYWALHFFFPHGVIVVFTFLRWNKSTSAYSDGIGIIHEFLINFRLPIY